MTFLRTVLLIFLLSQAMLVHAEATDADGLTTRELSDFLQQLQSAVASDNVAQVQALMRFPLHVNGAKKRKVTAAQFAANYTTIFPPPVKAALATQKVEDMLRNSQGAMVGNGQIWIAGICQDKECKKSQVRVITVNTP